MSLRCDPCEDGFVSSRRPTDQRRGLALVSGEDATEARPLVVSSEGGSSRIASDGDAAGTSNDPTVISPRQPLAEVAATRPSPLQLGQVLQGRVLDHFQLEEFVGGGGMGAVFRGCDNKLGRTVAVKVLSRDQNDPETQRRFRNEAQNAARLDHENIARVYYVGEADGLSYIVFEFIEGTNIRDLVEQNGPLPLGEAISYTLQVCEALRHASARDVVHRDIKPSNVLITPNGRAKLVDMGLARHFQVDSPGDDLTASGITLGTFDYISPEQARDPRSADVRSDLYSLGCTLFFMLTGRPPFPEGTVLQKLLSHSGESPPNPRDFRPDLPIGLVYLLDRMLAKNPSSRFQTPDELVDDLWRVADEAKISVSSVARALTPADRGPRRTWLSWLPVLGPLLLIAAAVYALEGFPAGGSAELPEPVFEESRDVPPAAPQPGPPTPRVEASDTPSAGSEPTAEPPPTPPKDNPPASSSEPSDGNPPAASDPLEPIEGVVILDEDIDERPIVYETLDEAVAALGRGPVDRCVLELRYSGVRACQPVRIRGRQVDIQAGEGHSPVVRFTPEVGDPAHKPRAMIDFLGERLSVRGVQLEMRIPRAPADGWSLLGVGRRARMLELAACSLTMVDGANAAFIRLVGGEPAGVGEEMMQELSGETSRVVDLFFQDFIMRGDAAGLVLDTPASVRLSWRNGLLATSQAFVEVRAAGGMLQKSWNLEVETEFVTAWARDGFVRVTASGQRLPQVTLRGRRSIWMTDRPTGVDGVETPLVRQLFPSSDVRPTEVNLLTADSLALLAGPTQPLLDLIDVAGERQTLADAAPSVAAELIGTVPWQAAVATDQPLETRRPADFRLAANEEDGDIGLQADRLPSLSGAGPAEATKSTAPSSTEPRT